MLGLRKASRRFGVAMSIACVAVAGAQARPFTVDDLLRQASFGPTITDPAGRWLVFEQRDPYVATPSFDYSTRNDVAGGRLRIVDLRRPGLARSLLAASDGPGDMALAVSPDGARLAIQRLQNHTLQVGVVTVATGDVRWLGVTLEDPYTNRAVQWRSADELIVLARKDGDLPLLYRVGSQSAAELPARWAVTARGGVSTTVLGSGAAATIRARPNPSRLISVNVRTGSSRVLAQGEIVDFELAPDGKHLALLETGEDLQPAAGATVQGAWGMQTERRRLSLLALATGERIQALPEADILDSLLTWRADGQELLVFARSPGAPWTAGRLWRIEAPSARAGCAMPPELTAEVRLRPERVSAAWMGREPIFLAKAGAPSSRPDWYRLGAGGPINLTRLLPAAPGAPFTVTSRGASFLQQGMVWRFDRDGRIESKTGKTVSPIAWTRSPRARRLNETPPTEKPLVSQPGALGPTVAGLSPGFPPILMPTGAAPIAFARQTATVIATLQTPEGVESLAVLRPHAPPAIVATINAHLADVAPPRLAAIDVPGKDGLSVRSWLYLPPDRRPGPPPPLIVRPYLGETYPRPYVSGPPPGALFANIRLMVGRGYAVLIPGLPRPKDGSEPLEGLADRVLAVVDAAAARPDLKNAFDPKRLALWGHSYGGYSTLGILTQTRRFRAAVVSAPPTNLLSFWGTFQPSWRVVPQDGVWIAWPTGWVETAQGGMGEPPWAAPERYVRNSPALLADRINTPVLLLHGDQDPIPVSQSEQMFSALYRQGKTASLVTYWGEDHLLNSPGTVRDLYARGFDWIDTYVGGPISGADGTPTAHPEAASASAGPKSQ
ncbi:MAG: prolyl oligopeptidase family serine peptidase [Alphaproteobacteria bacterium]|nr:prolyl oligopeptidase family serine peptidase [Alphaproteobacteria bacterium]MBU1516537.1 prolyl oligopeptidase family serine peptidase [Alphaproteobacteria bacterium]MBU2094294.1 prolyl oligopeptidase family serine peptidase [Alphaproteobacteria bacterium]MBU2154129.1 prolyl oligopeptidase family serine peptidase [Alphaproteobacteria bacterium]MBU2307464.1 prolyl oligopeptidase family serine peptidase [Alphaproteobacteria bacterium]